ncbi:MAG: ChbG/HpnK family deacetylase [Spirochaetales bacterium]|nr:ChbG/HpnK family deacetylase [Spirochaetales bacterium]
MREKYAALPEKGIILVVNGDDVGIAEKYTDATFEALFSGKITSASIVPGGHDAERAISILMEHPEFEIGIHLALVGNWKPLALREEAPSVYGPAGTLWQTDQAAQKHVLAEDAKIEWEAQIRKVRDAGIGISHLDSHKGCYFYSPEHFTAAWELARKYHLPIVSPYNPSMPAEWRENLPFRSYSGLYRLPQGIPETAEYREKFYLTMFANYPDGLHYLFTHHGRLPEGEQPEGDMDLRLNEFAFWTDPQTEGKLKKLGVTLKTFRDLREEYGLFLK